MISEIGEKDSRKRDLGALGREGLSEMMTFGQNPEKGARRGGGGYGAGKSHVGVCGKSLPGREKSKCQGPEAGECCAFLKITRRLEQGSAHLSYKGPDSKIFSFESCTVFMSTLSSATSHCGVKAATTTGLLLTLR